VIAVKAIGVLLAMAAAFFDFNNRLRFDFCCVGQGIAKEQSENQATQRGFFVKHGDPFSGFKKALMLAVYSSNDH
jgi:hypothetical protein